jgi:LemA protein
MGSNVITGAAFLLFVVGILIYVVILYNELVRLRNDNDRAWANIDVLLKQRHDEIPNLVETVKGYMQHEQQTLVAVTQARAASMNAASIVQKATADLMMTGALRGLFAVAENYPQLKANENFLKLQNRITELEERIADRREFFNDDVNTYNTRIGQIPEVFVASFMSLKARAMFKVSDEDRRLVEVKFAGGPGVSPAAVKPKSMEADAGACSTLFPGGEVAIQHFL